MVRALAAVVTVLLCWWPAVAAACPVCSSRQDGSSYTVMAVVLLAFPLALLLGFFLWLRRTAMLANANQRDGDKP